jgi:hypothetical protein
VEPEGKGLEFAAADVRSEVAEFGQKRNDKLKAEFKKASDGQNG